jgi:protein Xni
LSSNSSQSPPQTPSQTSLVLLIDGFNLVRRIYEAHPNRESAIEEVSEAAARSLQRALNRHHPSHAVVVFERHDRTWRHLLYADYKGGRKPTPEPLLHGIAAMEKRFERLGVHSFSLPNYEADDVIATLTAGITHAGSQVVILSTDKSYLQLIGAGVRIFNHFDQTEYREDEITERHGVCIAQLTDFWALSGDASNNIKGVPKIGKKSAAALLSRYTSLEEILISKDDDPKVSRVQADASNAGRCKQLVTLKRDVELGINLQTFRLEGTAHPDSQTGQ